MPEKPTFVTRLGELPPVQWALFEASKAYTRTREKNLFTKMGFLAIEMTTKVAVMSSKIAYNVTPIPQFVKDKILEQVDIADSIACCGLEVIAKKYPIITQPPNACILPAEQHPVESSNSTLAVHPVESSNSTLAVWTEQPPENTSNFIGTMANVPVQMTRAGFSGVKYVLSTTISTTGSVLSFISFRNPSTNNDLSLCPVTRVEYPDRGLIDSVATTTTNQQDTTADYEGYTKWTTVPFVGVCLCCCACVCLSVSVCAVMCLTTLLCGGVCHWLFIGLWFYYRAFKGNSLFSFNLQQSTF